MIKSILAGVGVVVALMVGGCGGNTQGEGQAMKVGLILPGSASDHGWGQLAKESLDKVAAREKVEVRVLSAVPAEKAADAFRQFDKEGYALVIGHGFEYRQAAAAVAEGPNAVKLKVVVSGSNIDDPHFQSLFYDLGPASYQLGIVAARVSKSGKIGFIGGGEIPTVTVMFRGFEAGAKSVNPAIVVSTPLYPGWDSKDKAKTAAETLLAQNVDVIMQNVDAASSGVFEAVKEWNAKGNAVVYTFGANADQNGNEICGGFTLASAVIKMDEAFDGAVKQVKAGTFKPGVVKVDVGSGMAVAVLNPKLVGNVIDAETVKRVEEAGKKLGSGEIKVE